MIGECNTLDYFVGFDYLDTSYVITLFTKKALICLEIDLLI